MKSIYDLFGSKRIIKIWNIDNCANNYLFLKNIALQTNTKCAVTIKNRCYGAPVEKVCKALYGAGCRDFFVGVLEEGIEIRKIVPNDANIYVFTMVSGDERLLISNNLIPCLTSYDKIESWNKVSNGRGAIIDIDTGMNRFGLTEYEVNKLAENFDSVTENINILYYMSHFFDLRSGDFNNCKKQISKMRDLSSRLPYRPITYSSTDAFLLFNEANFDLVRPGIAIFGGGGISTKPFGLRHVLDMYVKISQFKHVNKGSFVGYGRNVVAEHDMKTAVVDIGYGTGYLSIGSNGHMFVAGHTVPIISVCANVTIIDITEVPDSELNGVTYAEIIGINADVRDLADACGQNFEIFSALGKNIDPVYVNEFAIEDGKMTPLSR